MANTNNLEFLGREGLTTLLDHVNTNTLTYKEKTTTETITVTNPPETLHNPLMCYGGGRLVCIEYNSDLMNSIAYYSNDKGQTWQPGAFLGHSKGLCKKLVFGNGIFVGITDQSEDNFYYSTDGISWNTAWSDNPALWSVYDDIAFGDGKFIAVNDRGGAWSTDGITWSSFEASGFYVAIGNGRVVITDTTGMYSVYSLDGNSIVSSAFIPGMDPINGIKFVNNQFVCYGNVIATSSDGENWTTRTLYYPFPEDDPAYGSSDIVVDIHYIQGKYIAYGAEPWSSSDNGNSWAYEGPNPWYMEGRTAADNLLFGVLSEATEYTLFVSADGIYWDRSANITSLKAVLEQAGTDITSKVAKLVGGNGSTVDLENATLENLTITGALTIDGDFTFGDLDATTVTAEKVVVSNDPVDDNDVATKKYVDEHSGSGDTSSAAANKTSGTTGAS
jgi:hypothetical protein